MIRLIVPFIYFMVSPSSIVTTKTKCTDTYSPAIYAISSKFLASPSCKPSECLLQSQINVIERDHFDEYLNFTLISYGVSESEARSIGLQLTKPISSTNPTTSNILYSCAKLESGLTSAKVTIDTYSKPIGSSIYLNGNLYCSWIVSRNDGIWPLDGDRKANLVEDNNFHLYLLLNGSKVMVANETTNLPIYQRRYIRTCCRYRVLGNTNYQLITKRSSDGQLTDFMLQFNDSSPDLMQLVMAESNETALIVECSFAKSSIKFYSTIGTEIENLSNRLKHMKIYNNRCSWTLSDEVVVNKRLTISMGSTKFQRVQIMVDRSTVFSESNFSLTGFSNQIKSNLLIVTLTIIFLFSIQ